MYKKLINHSKSLIIEEVNMLIDMTKVKLQFQKNMLKKYKKIRNLSKSQLNQLSKMNKFKKK